MQVEGKISLLQGVTKPELVEICLAFSEAAGVGQCPNWAILGKFVLR